MKKSDELKKLVKEKYSQIAILSEQDKVEYCCDRGVFEDEGASCCTTFNDSYENLPGYNKEADLKLGCGLPTEFSEIKEGDTVVDLGCGAGNDIFVASSLTGESGVLVGVDFSEEMLKKANKNRDKLNKKNIEFKLGELESLPLKENFADVIISNCVLNLVPDKEKVFAEISRVLRPGGHFSISDIVIKGELPEKLVESASLYTGCVSGAVSFDRYMDLIKSNNFTNIQVKSSKRIDLPNELLKSFLTEKEIEDLNNNKFGVFSVTINATKS